MARSTGRSGAGFYPAGRFSIGLSGHCASAREGRLKIGQQDKILPHQELLLKSLDGIELIELPTRAITHVTISEEVAACAPDGTANCPRRKSTNARPRGR